MANAALTTRDPERHLLANPSLADPKMSPALYADRLMRGVKLRQKAPWFILKREDADIRWIGGRKPTDDEFATMLIAWVVAWCGTSNSVVLAKNMMLIGPGLGQQDRRGATKLAIMRAEDAGHDITGAFFASDGFFPFPKAADETKLLEATQLLLKVGCRGGIVPADGKRLNEVIDFLEASGMIVGMVHKSHRGFSRH